MPQVIRAYEPADLNALLSSWEAASRLAHPFLTEEFLALERKNIQEVYIPKTANWVAELEGTVVGFISMMGHEVGGLFVQPEFHGTGTGRALMDIARELYGDLKVEVFTENAIGLRFYKSYGFEIVSESIHKATGNPIVLMTYTETAA